MSHNVLKLSKPHSQPTIHPVTSTHSLYHPQNHPSIDYPKERDSVSHSKDHSNSHAGIKKLANMLNPRKERGLTLQDIHNSMSPNHTSPKGFLENSSKMNKLRVSTSTHENQNLNLISPKDLVRMAMSKHKSKANLKKVSNPTTTGSNQRNMRKSHSLRFGPGIAGLEKREGSSKLISSSIVDESNALSRTSLASKDKTAKLRRMKQIYNDITPTEIARQTRSTMYTPVNETSGRFWQDSLSPNRSNSGNLLPASPAVVTSATSQQNNAVNKSKHHTNAVQSKEEKSHSEQMGAFLKEYKPSMKQGKRQEKKTLQARKMPSMENIKQNSMSFSRLMSHPTLNLGEKNRSPMKGMERDEEVVKAAEILEESDEMKGKDIKPREEFIADLKNWVNDIVKPSEEKGGQQQQQVQQGKKSVGPAEKVKEAQEGLLEKLRDALENDEFVRREDYERLYREKDVIEEELDEVKEENSKLREIVWQMQQELERKKSVLPMNISMSDHDGELLETIGKLQKEVEMYRKRENVVKDVIKLIWKAGIEIGGLGFDEDIQEVHEGEEEEHTQAVKKSKQGSKYESPEKFYHNNNHYNVHDVHEEFGKDEDDGMHFELYNKGLLGQKDEMENAEETPKTKVVKALSELGDSETEPSDRNGNLQGLPMNPQSEKKLKSAGIGGKSNSTGKLKIDLRGLGGNLTIPKKQTSLPCNTSNNKSIDKMNPCVIPEGVQALGFHEEFMSKLEEFSLSWRQAALDHQKF